MTALTEISKWRDEETDENDERIEKKKEMTFFGLLSNIHREPDRWSLVHKAENTKPHDSGLGVGKHCTSVWTQEKKEKELYE